MLPSPLIRDARAERGASSLAVLVALLPLLLIAGSFLRLVTSGQREGRQAMDLEDARSLADAAAHEALYRISHTRELHSDSELVLGAGRAQVQVRSWEGDGIDNDSNGLIDDELERGMFVVKSEAFLRTDTDAEGGMLFDPTRSLSRRTIVTGHLNDLDFGFRQAIYLDDPTTQIDVNGGAFLLSGHDQNLDGSDGSEESQPAIGVAGDPAGIIAQIGKNQATRIAGDLPSPAIGRTDRLFFDDYRELIAPLATVTFEESENAYSGKLGVLDPPIPVIAHSKGTLKLHGEVTGCGVLLVDGDLILSGRFRFAGVLLVRGRVEFNGGGSKQELQGALALWGESLDSSEDLRINGTVQVAYSSEALAVASGAAGIESLLWISQ